MKKNVSLLILTASLLASCASTVVISTSSAPASSLPASEEPAVSLETYAESDENWVDYYNSGLAKLDHDYKNRTFFKDGIEKVTLKSPIDGDTAHFYTADHQIVKARFFGINTPESTGDIEPWGKQASNFTTGILKEADANGTIVVSSPTSSYGIPQADSTGSRYVSLIWVSVDQKDCPYDQLKFLNLYIVQEGYSPKESTSAYSLYDDVLTEADAQAKKYQLRTYSDEPDPMFNYGDYLSTSLLDIKHEIEAQIKDPSHENKYNNAKAKIVGTVSGYANGVLYLQNFYTVAQGGDGSATNPYTGEKGEYAGINIYTGAAGIPSKYTVNNTYLQVCGTLLDSEVFGFQMSGASWLRVPMNENDAQILISPEDNVEEQQLYSFHYSSTGIATAITNKDSSALNSQVIIDDPLTCTGGYVNDSGDAWTLYFGRTVDAYVTFIYRPYDDQTTVWRTIDQFQGHSFYLSGVLAVHKTTKGNYAYQICPRDRTQLVLADATSTSEAA